MKNEREGNVTLPVVSAMKGGIIFFFHKSYFLSKLERWIKKAIVGPWHHVALVIRNNTKKENILLTKPWTIRNILKYIPTFFFLKNSVAWAKE